VTPDENSSGSDDTQQPSEPVFNWALAPTEEPARPRDPPELIEPPELAEPPVTEAFTSADVPTGLLDIADIPSRSASDLPTEAINSADMPTAAMEFPTRRQLRMPVAVDPALEGATEVLGAHPVSAAGPEDESVEHDAVSALFGDEQFVEYQELPRSALVPAVISRPHAPQPPRPPIPRGQLIAISIATGIVAALALTALFLGGTRIGDSLAPVAVVTPTPTPTVTASVAPAIGPLLAGTYAWNELLGGECLDPFDSVWQDEYIVVDCTQPHAGQLLSRAQFDDAVSEPYPGLDELVSRTNVLCSTDAVIDFAAAKSFADLELAASFAPTAENWDAGQRDYYCFATRTGDDALTASVAQPQVAAATEGE
jgi:hypothetical protein